jgi:Zn-dependent peptidase ImmA (M78 family)
MTDKFDEKVRELLSRFHVRRPPVPVEQIAKKLNLKIAAVPAEDDISGAIIREGAHVVIAVNTSHHPNRQRFTVAHELGHYFFHHGLQEHVDRGFRIAWRNSDSSKAIDWLEIEANRFAAELLMPTEFLIKDLNAQQRIEKRTVALLASRYQVSPEAMKIRLTNLGIIGPF